MSIGRRLFVFAVLCAFFTVAAGPALAANPTSGPQLAAISAPQIGHDFEVLATGLGPDVQVHFFVSTARLGVTTTVVDGVAVSIPLLGAQSFATLRSSGSSALASYVVPKDKNLVGAELYVVAVVVSGNRAIISPVMPSGPILGDAIA
ncbi:MAG: hypothetical protein R3F20_10600 [Planctomycetota bacterium]